MCYEINMEDNLKLFEHVYVDNGAERTLVLLHGTGGNERNLLFFDEVLDKKYNLLGLRGNIDEHGKMRFFRRFEDGSFDMENIRSESEKLRQFIEAWCEKSNMTKENLVWLGYSNGANMILTMVFEFPELIKRAVLLHGMLPWEPDAGLRLDGHEFFVSYGTYDQLILDDDSETMVAKLRELGVNVEVHEYQSGHELTHEEISDAVNFLNL